MFLHRQFARTFLVILTVFNLKINISHGKYTNRCEFVQEFLRLRPHMTLNDVNDWTCLVEHQSNFDRTLRNVDAEGNAYFGIFQISDRFWCSTSPFIRRECNLRCDQLTDANLADDIECALRIYAEHSKIAGNGFSAWPVHALQCRAGLDYVSNCVAQAKQAPKNVYTNNIFLQRAAGDAKKSYPKSKSTTQIQQNAGKVFKRCELAQELRYKHNVPKDQVHTWICIADQLSSLNTATVSAFNQEGFRSFGLFQINEQFWCSSDAPSNGCGLRCDDLTNGDISDDIQCARRVFNEHQRIFGNGFQAWPIYEHACRSAPTTNDCFDDEPSSNVHPSVVATKIASLTTSNVAKGKVYERCELARELRYQHNLPRDEIAIWTCIALYQSNFVTSAVRASEHGLFQITDKHWCSLWGRGKGCGLACSELEDSDISNDIQCARKIHDEHHRITGDGFTAWRAYEPYCKGQAEQLVADCFPDENSQLNTNLIAASSPTYSIRMPPKTNVASQAGKVYERCELAHELRFKHNMPRDQIHMWVCIAHHESHFNTAAIGQLNADGSGDHGIFQISDLFWCSIDGSLKACGEPCSKFEDSDISDDVACVKRIHAEHQQLSGDGFNAWAVYEPYCKYRATEFTRDCFDDVENEINNSIVPEHHQSIASTVAPIYQSTHRPQLSSTTRRPTPPPTTRTTTSTAISMSVASSTGKAYERCELARELYSVHRVPFDQIAEWTCIALYQSNFVTSARGVREHGLFQISDEFWCSLDGQSSHGCGLSCAQLEDDNIADDIACARQIYDEHQRISGNGFSAWAVYEPYCRGRSTQYIHGCFADINVAKTQTKPTSIHRQSVSGSASTTGKVYGRCELARELRNVYALPSDQIHIWLCIVQQQSKFNTSFIGSPHAVGKRGFGLFQINEKFWCASDENASNNSDTNACNLRCANLIDNNIADDVHCAQKIHDEHQRLYGNGFHAWNSYESYCRYQSAAEISDCFESNGNTQLTATEIARSYTPRGRVYDRCELARELRFKHNMPRDKLHMWVCIAEHESHMNTSAVGRKNVDGGSDHGIFQISDLFWCSTNGERKMCNIPCTKLADSDISDDVQCSKQIFQEHERLFGDGFHAWKVYEPHCKRKTSATIDDCFGDKIVIHQPTPSAMHAQTTAKQSNQIKKITTSPKPMTTTTTTTRASLTTPANRLNTYNIADFIQRTTTARTPPNQIQTSFDEYFKQFHKTQLAKFSGKDSKTHPVIVPATNWTLSTTRNPYAWALYTTTTKKPTQTTRNFHQQKNLSTTTAKPLTTAKVPRTTTKKLTTTLQPHTFTWKYSFPTKSQTRARWNRK